MKKYTLIGILAIAMFFSASAVNSQSGGFVGPTAFTGQQVGFTMPQGFTGSTIYVSVAHMVSAFPDKAPAILRGYIIGHLGSDRYLFRDASGNGEVVIKIKNDRWWGLTVGPNDLVELGGELKRERNGMIKYFDAKSIRLAV